MPANPLLQMARSCLVAALNLLLVLLGTPNRHVIRTIGRCAAFALLTAAMLNDGVVPTQVPWHMMSPEVRFIWGALEIAWWMLAASTVAAVVRTYYILGGRLRERRFMLDVIGKLLYLSVALAIITDVFHIPLKGVLATSGALAIVLGLALQSTLSDLFSGLLINSTAPYRVGDCISLDSSTEGRVVEITWRATHLARANRDLIVIPNSTIAKSRIVNASVPGGPHATTARFQAPSRFRPSDVVHALQLAADTCIGIATRPAPVIMTRSVGFEATDYEVSFFASARWQAEEVLNTFYDAAHRHLESFHVLIAPIAQADDASAGTSEYRLVEGIRVFGLLERDERMKLATALVRRELTPVRSCWKRVRFLMRSRSWAMAFSRLRRAATIHRLTFCALVRANTSEKAGR
jgi:small-conductance mechanosensitive channel